MININEASYSYKRSLEEQLKKISIKIIKEKLSYYAENLVLGKQL
ncbi:Uncharacterised protein [Peptoniphilus harei]|uniref:Uncharacterized protein n=1 Tax=Peptoniphilus harei TaxID=54005 RepID=A0A2X1YVF7_9FIRM|nr:hypothetical protein [Peptoniphilus harei]SPY36264.1 Uncharacterised protein [Peptoniphilus harei]